MKHGDTIRFRFQPSPSQALPTQARLLSGYKKQIANKDTSPFLNDANGIDILSHPVLTIGDRNGTWGFAVLFTVETATQAIRMVLSGAFETYPNLKVILGHMGEGLPYVLWRLDSRWNFHNHHGIELAKGNPSQYIRDNLYITTSGVCSGRARSESSSSCR
jgi:2,3-dihydroxybenzoate decarboxylase